MMNRTIDQAKDTGMAMVLILLLIAYFWEVPSLLGWAILVLLAVMIWPPIFSPLARLWFGLSHLMGTVASKVLLTIVFLVITMPIGLLRRLLGFDSMRRKQWKKGTESVMIARDHRFVAGDLERPY
jgi:hypothetical protein